MPSCCLNSSTCLAERQRAMRLNGPFGWGIKCMDCIEGCARQMDKWRPEPDVHDTQSPAARRKYDPLPPSFCSMCGKPITRGATRCRACLDSTRTKTKGPKPERDRTRCRNGHSLEKYGMSRNDGGVRCRICTRNRKHEAYQRAKEATT